VLEPLDGWALRMGGHRGPCGRRGKDVRCSGSGSSCRSSRRRFSSGCGCVRCSAGGPGGPGREGGRPVLALRCAPGSAAGTTLLASSLTFQTPPSQVKGVRHDYGSPTTDQCLTPVPGGPGVQPQEGLPLGGAASTLREPAGAPAPAPGHPGGVGRCARAASGGWGVLREPEPLHALREPAGDGGGAPRGHRSRRRGWCARCPSTATAATSPAPGCAAASRSSTARPSAAQAEEAGAAGAPGADIHYPAVEMAGDAKLSCVCWSPYSRNVLASTDYKGIVQVCPLRQCCWWRFLLYCCRSVLAGSLL